MFHATMLAAIDGARTHAQIDYLTNKLWSGHGGGVIDESGAETLANLLAARRRALRDSVAPVGIPAGRASLFPPRVRQRSPDLIESRYRRREHAATGPMPPVLARRFTTGQLAVLRIVGEEWAEKGVCSLAIDAIAARAGVSGRWAQMTLRLAEGDGLIVIQERRREGRKSDPSLVRVLSREWQQWLSKRAKRRHQAGARPSRDDRVNSASPHGQQSFILAPKRQAEPKEGYRRVAGDASGRAVIRIGAGGRTAGAMR